MSAPEYKQDMAPEAAPETEFWELRLYVAGHSPRSMTAFANLKRLAEQHLAGRYRIEVIDLIEHPLLADDDQILAVPTLVRRLPPPLRKVVGDLSDESKTLVGMNLVPLGATAAKGRP